MNEICHFESYKNVWKLPPFWHVGHYNMNILNFKHCPIFQLHNIKYVCLCGAMRHTLAWTSLTHCVACLRPTYVIVGRHIGSGTARQLLRESSNFPRKILEMAIKRTFTLLYKNDAALARKTHENSVHQICKLLEKTNIIYVQVACNIHDSWKQSVSVSVCNHALPILNNSMHTHTPALPYDL